MAFRFRNSVRIASGIRLTISKNEAVFSADIKNPTQATSNPSGLDGILLPGTDLYYRTRLNNSLSQRKRAEQEEKRQSRRESQQAALKNNQDFAELALALDDQGNLLIHSLTKQPLPAEEHGKLLMHYKSDIQEWLEEQVEVINGDIDLLTNAHIDTLTPDTTSLRHQINPFTELQPEQPNFEQPAIEPVKPPAPELTWKDSLILGRKSKRLSEWQAAVDAWQIAHQTWQANTAKLHAMQAAPLAAYQAKLDDWRAKKEVHDTEQRELAAAFSDRLTHDTQVMTEVLKAELNALDWARDTLINFDLDSKGQHLKLDVDLPEINTLSMQEARVSVRDLKLIITKKTETQIHREYARHVHGVVLRLISTAFHTLQSLEELTVSSYSQSLDPVTGEKQNNYLFSVNVKRSVFESINFYNLKEVDPVIALERFDPIRDMSQTGAFNPIEPLN